MHEVEFKKAPALKKAQKDAEKQYLLATGDKIGVRCRSIVDKIADYRRFRSDQWLTHKLTEVNIRAREKAEEMKDDDAYINPVSLKLIF